MDEVSDAIDMSLRELWHSVGEGIALSFNRAADFEYRSDEHGWIVGAGVPIVDFNCALVMPGPDSSQTLAKAARHFRKKSMPFLVCLVGQNQAIQERAKSLDLSDIGQLPLMVHRDANWKPIRYGAEIEIREAVSEADSKLTAELAEICFGLSLADLKRAMPYGQPRPSQLRTLMAFRGGRLAGAVTFSRNQHGYGIWSLMTAPELRRQGIGWRLMNEAFQRIRSVSNAPIFLVATPDGKPLYEQFGFKTVDIGSVWVDQGSASAA